MEARRPPLGVSSLLPSVGLRTQGTRVVSFIKSTNAFHISFSVFANMYIVKQRLSLLKEKRGQTARDVLIVLCDISRRARLASREDRSMHCGAALFLRSYPRVLGASRPY